jgi:hypothetical protein
MAQARKERVDGQDLNTAHQGLEERKCYCSQLSAAQLLFKNADIKQLEI